MQDESEQNLNPAEPEPTPSPLQGEGGGEVEKLSPPREEGPGEVIESAAPAPPSGEVFPSPGDGEGLRERSLPTAQSLLQKALAAIQFRKQKKFEKIMAFAAAKPFITNDQVEKLLHVSDATATRYLVALVRQGRLKRVGGGHASRYEPMNGSNPGN